tara:strand:- start:1037 stop:1213 length:177 start_codon:yes stop_codon:yes gene_type:complete
MVFMVFKKLSGYDSHLQELLQSKVDELPGESVSNFSHLNVVALKRFGEPPLPLAQRLF